MALEPPAARDAPLTETSGSTMQLLASRSRDAIAILPLYPAADAAPLLLPASPSWRVVTRIDHPDLHAALDQAVLDQEGGADVLVLVGRGAPAAHGFGAALADPDHLGRLLAFGQEHGIALRIEPGDEVVAVVESLAALAAEHGGTIGPTPIDLGLDPFGRVGSGLDRDGAAMAMQAVAAFSLLRERGFAGRVFTADGRIVHAAGGTDAQELAFVLAAGVAVLRWLEPEGVPLDLAATGLCFTLAADADLLFTAAKCRALRWLWARVESACGIVPTPIALHAETAWRMLSRRDPATNMLRNTLAAAGAVLGGADTIAVLPHTAALGLPDAAARRLARNTGLVLRDEAHLGRVADPLAGSGAVEAWTAALAAEAWALFGAIEREGGLPGSLASGAFARRVAAARAAAPAPTIVGTTLYPAPDAVADAATVLMPAWAASDPSAALAPHRTAAPFEPIPEVA